MKKSAPYLSIVSPEFLNFLELIGKTIGILNIRISGLTLGWLIISRNPMTEKLERHESVHVLQFLEICTCMLILGVAVSAILHVMSVAIPAWAAMLYLAWLVFPGINPGVLTYQVIFFLRRARYDKYDAYRFHPMELEARHHETSEKMFADRRYFGWILMI